MDAARVAASLALAAGVACDLGPVARLDPNDAFPRWASRAHTLHHEAMLSLMDVGAALAEQQSRIDLERERERVTPEVLTTLLIAAEHGIVLDTEALYAQFLEDERVTLRVGLRPTEHWLRHIKRRCTERYGGTWTYSGQSFACYEPRCDDFGCSEGKLLVRVVFQ